MQYLYKYTKQISEGILTQVTCRYNIDIRVAVFKVWFMYETALCPIYNEMVKRRWIFQTKQRTFFKFTRVDIGY